MSLRRKCNVQATIPEPQTDGSGNSNVCWSARAGLICKCKCAARGRCQAASPSSQPPEEERGEAGHRQGRRKLLAERRHHGGWCPGEDALDAVEQRTSEGRHERLV